MGKEASLENSKNVQKSTQGVKNHNNVLKGNIPLTLISIEGRLPHG